MMIDKKTFWIGVMTIVAAVLLAAHVTQPGTLMPVANANASEWADHRDWAMSTALTAAGGEVVYILDKRNGRLALLTWNTRERKPEFATEVVYLPSKFNPLP